MNPKHEAPPLTESTLTAAAKAQSSTVAGNAGRGGLAVAAAKMYFLVIGLVQQVLLTRVLGTAGYGALSTVLSLSAVVYNPIVTTSIQGVSRTVAQSTDAERPSATRAVLRMHAALAVPIAALFYGLAGPLTAAVHAAHVADAVRLMALVLLFYGIYAPLIGVFNGQRRFVWQAGFDIAYATLRTLLMVGGGYLIARQSGHGVWGAALGFVCASALIAAAALPLAGTGAPGKHGPKPREYLVFVGPVFAGQVLLNLLQQADLTVLRYFAAASAISGGKLATLADPLVGAYRATQLFCFLPYQLLLSVTFVLFPLLAKAHRDGSTEDVKTYVMTGIRLALLASGAMVSVISGLSGPLLRLVFTDDVAFQATSSMQLLALGFGAFAIFGILSTVLTSLKQERKSALVTGLAFLLVSSLGCILLRGQPFGASLLIRTAIATATGLLIATGIATYYVYRHAGGVVAPLTLLRVLIAVTATVILGRYWSPSSRAMTLVAVTALATAHVTLLVLMRELTQRDLRQVLSVFRHR